MRLERLVQGRYQDYLIIIDTHSNMVILKNKITQESRRWYKAENDDYLDVCKKIVMDEENVTISIDKQLQAVNEWNGICR